jgi:hypothetical protein
VTDQDSWEGIVTGWLEVLATWVFARKYVTNPRIARPSSWKAVLVKASAWSSDSLGSGQSHQKDGLKGEVLEAHLIHGLKGQPRGAPPSTTERYHLGDEWRIRGRSKVMFRVRDEMVTSQSEPQDPCRWRVK